jgi:hypothetical protein
VLQLKGISRSVKRNPPESSPRGSRKKSGWELCFAGMMAGLVKFLNHQKALAEKRETRKMIADMCGTSYAAACADMGMKKI